MVANCHRHAGWSASIGLGTAWQARKSRAAARRTLSGLPQLLMATVLMVFSIGVWSMPAYASIDAEVATASQIVRDAVVKLDVVKAADARTVLLRQAVEAFGVLENFAATQADGEAREQINALATDAITADVLRLSLVGALSDTVTADDSSLKQDLEAKAIVGTIVDPAYRAAAWTQLARTHMRIQQPAEAERLATRSVETAKQIDRKPTRDGALRAAILIFPLDRPGISILEIAANAMTSASARSEIYRLVAIAQLGNKKLGKDDVAAMVQDALDKASYPKALQAAQTLERDDGRRKEFLDTILTKTLKAGDEGLTLQTAKSMSRDKEQDKALRKIVDARIDRGVPLRANELVPLMLTVEARTDAQIAIADGLGEQGYDKAARDLIDSISVSPTDDPNAAADLASALAKIGAFDKARDLANRIGDAAERSFAFSRLSKRLADDNRIDESRSLLSEVTDADDLSFAKSGIARALAKSGKLDQAKAMLDAISAPADRDRALEEVGTTEAQAGDLDEARSTLGKVNAPESRSRILVSIALALKDKDPAGARDALTEARKLLVGDDDADMAAIAVAYAKIGDMAASSALLGTISNAKIKDKAERSITDLMVHTGALEKISAPFAAAPPSSLTAALAWSHFKRDGDVEAFIGAVHDLPYRVRIAALRQMADARARQLDVRGWLSNASIDPLAPAAPAELPRSVNFNLSQYVVKAPAPETRSLNGIVMPEIFALDASVMRAQVPAPAAGVAHLAILGFSPFSLEAFKLTSGGTAAIHQVQISQNLTWPRYIAIEKGVVTLGALMRDLPEVTTRNLLVENKDALLIRVPIIVLPGATLLMSGTEFAQYRLGARSGAFIAVAGKLVVQDTEVIGFDEQENAPAVASDATKEVFRPFITAWGGSDLQLSGSRFAMLGYASSKAFGLTQSSGAAIQSLYALVDNRPGGNIVDNSFENLRYGYYSYEADGVRLIGNEYRDNIIYGIDPHDRSRDMLIALNTAYGSKKKHGIIVSREVDNSFIVGNVSIDNKGSGMMLDRTSSHNIVYANTALNNEGDGLTFYESGCNVAAANDLSGNKRAGVKIRNSASIGVYDNLIGGNLASGTDIYVADLKASPEGGTRNFQMDPYEPVSTSALSGNAFSGNGNAINATGASQIILDANHFRNERSNIYAGDLRQLSPYLLQLGDVSTILIGTTCQPAKAADICNLQDWSRAARSELICTGMSKPLNGSVEKGGHDG
jgi:poly(beta-D-mannuronate) C5 epimerase